MDFTGLLFIAFGLTYIGSLIYLANQIEAARTTQSASHRLQTPSSALPASGSFSQVVILRWMLFGLIAMMFSVGFIVLQAALFSTLVSDLDEEMQALQLEVDSTLAVITFILALIVCFASFRIITSQQTRQRLQQFLSRWGSYDPDSSLHTVAVVLMFSVVVWTLVTFVLQGGIQGMADELATRGIDPGDLVFQAFLQVVISLLGVGLAIRRDWSQVLARLGLRIPTREDLTWGAGLGVACIGFVMVFNAVWLMLTSPEVFAEQTAAAEQLSRSFTTIPLAFILATSASVGEEIWIRGALQPVFGLVPSTIFFVLLHTQVLLTPAVLVILVVSLCFGWLRQRHSTTAAVVAHFVYDFIPLAIASTLPLP
jgi:membrane protease YdiL (CAAX protease family)